jgi:hypothetical protein
MYNEECIMGHYRASLPRGFCGGFSKQRITKRHHAIGDWYY